MTRFTRALLSLASTAALAMALPAAHAEDIDVVMAVPATTLTFSALYVAQDAGFYAKEGLKVTERVIVGVGATNAVIAGSADFTVGTGATFVRAVAKGQKLIALATLVDRPLVELVLRKDVADAAGINANTPIVDRAKALKGRTIAVQGIGSIIHAHQRLVSKLGGLDPDKDVRVSPMSPPAMFPAMKANKIDGYATSLPFTTQGIINGDAIMIASGPRGDLPEFIPFAYVLLQTRPEVCSSQREKCVRMAHALRAATKYIKENKAGAFELLRKRFSRLNTKLLAAAWDTVQAAHANDVRVTLKSLENAQDFNIRAGLLEEKDALRKFDGLFTDAYLR